MGAKHPDAISADGGDDALLDSGTPLTPPPTIDDPAGNFYGTAWALVARAAEACGNVSGLPPWNGPVIDNNYFWYVYYGGRQPSLAADCVGRLQLEQNMVCVADKLAEIGDAVGNIVWPQTDFLTDPGSYTYGDEADAAAQGDISYLEWIIPPQADSDRFIVRDLAIHTLGMIPVMDGYVDLLNQSCAASFAYTAIGQAQNGTVFDPTPGDETFHTIFGGGPGVPTFPPSAVPFVDSSGHNNTPTIAASALAIEAQILRGGAKLAHDLIRRDVYSDMAASAQQSAQALDPSQGNLLAWGVTQSPPPLNAIDAFGLGTSSAPYGSISHAARVLMGRWEIGDINDFPTTFQPTCEGVAALDLVSGALGSDLPARVNDMPITTAGEATASQLVDRSGIVLTGCGIAQTSSLRQALIDQLVTEQQLSDALPIDVTKQNLLETIYGNALSSTSDAEIAFAFRRALATYLLLTNAADPSPVAGNTCVQVAVPGAAATGPTGCPSSSALPAGLCALPTTSFATAVSALGGVVVQGGIARSRLHTDPMARAGGMLEASQCDEGSNVQWTSWGVSKQPILTPYLLPLVDFQDAFHVAQGFERQLVLLEALANNPRITGSAGIASGSNTNPEAVARGGIAELRTWAGSTMIHATPASPSSGQYSLQVEVAGASYADFNAVAGNTAAVASAFGFVYGPPWMAECAVHARSDCPANFDTMYVQTATAVADNSSAAAGYGTVDNVFELTVPLSAGPTTATQFQPPAPVNDQSPPTTTSHLYMVRLHDPSSPLGHGYVLGTIALRYHLGISCGLCGPNYVYDTVSLVDSPMQRELVHDAIDIGKWVGAAPPALGDQSAAQMSGYCVDGVPRDLFVPLDNELVNGGTAYEDSWQNYLSLAQTAAQTADALGQQLIAEDLQISQNQQAAEEQLANICGDFGSLSSATVQTDGTITGGADVTTQTCISEPRVDVVFLGTMRGGISSTTDTAGIKKALNCAGTNGATTPASTVALCEQPTLTAGALGIGAPPGGASTNTTVSLLSSACTDILTNIAPSFRTGFKAQEYLNDLQDSSLSASAMLNMVSQLQMSVDLNDNWKVMYGEAQIMDSVNAQYWPACIASGCAMAVGNPPPPNSVSKQTSLLAPGWSTAFRSCPAQTAGQPMPALGACGEGNSATELNVLKWRVMQAIWMIAASSGVLPEGMFYQPIPALVTDTCAVTASSATPGCSTDPNGPGGVSGAAGCIASELTTDPSTDPSCYNQNYPVGNANYYAGELALTTECMVNGVSPASICHSLSTSDVNTSLGDARMMGPLFPISANFGLFANSLDTPAANSEHGIGYGGEIPAWYGLVYNASQYPQAQHFFTGNASAIFDQCDTVFAPDQGACSKGTAGSAQVSLASLVGIAYGLDGLACSTNYGFPASSYSLVTDTTGGSWDNTVSDVKLSLSPQSLGIALAGARGVPTALPSSGYNQDDHGEAVPLELWDVSGTEIGQNGTQPFQNGGPGNVWPPSSGVVLPPTLWPPAARAIAFTGYTGVDGPCGANALLLQAAVLACTPSPVVSALATTTLSAPPQVQHLSDIPLLEAWLATASSTINGATGSFYVQEIPSRVVSDFANGTVGSGSLAGTKGQAILSMEQQIQQLPEAWVAIANDLLSISNAIQIANTAIVGNRLTEDTADGALALNTIVVQGAMTQAVDSFLISVASAAGNSLTSLGGSYAPLPADALAMADSLAMGSQELGQLKNMANTAAETEQNQVEQALAQLNSGTDPLWADVQKQIDSLRASVAQIDASGQTILQAQNEAAYQVAVATGSDFVNISGQEPPIPVDTVLRRQSSATLQRYQAALTNAKALAYMARRAIEQRIGVSLSELAQQIGPVDAPASWADDICSLQGVNYAALSTASPADGGAASASADQQVINQFANAWVGDYVAKLQNFVTYYNVQYPSHQGDDTAVLSLRYDLLPSNSQCSTQGPNLLANSGDMTQFGSSSWQLAPCNAHFGKCLEVIDGDALPTMLGGPTGDQSGTYSAGTRAPASSGVTWLMDVASAGTGGDAGASDGGSLDAGNFDAGGGGVTPYAGWPQNVVLQQVQLGAGSYVLSWWDQARDQNGNIAWQSTSTPPKYVAEVFDPTWHSVAPSENSPYTPPQVGDAGGPSLWSARHTLSFTVTSAGSYAVAFGASALGDGLGSVAIADVQLEQAQDAEATSYVATSDTTMVQGLYCPMSDADLRAAFTHTCDSNGACHYDLAAPVILDTSAIDGTPASAKLASGNYNYRHITSAINLVGTGVHSCTNDPSPDCYGSGYVQYDLQHDGSNSGIVGYDGNVRVFDFGVAAINHGKALAAEQYLTMPLSSSDSALISQPGIEHIEFGGRPLDGNYHLRIWDSPDLNFGALQDIQIILNYEYWSAIQVSGNTGDVRRPQIGHKPIKPIFIRRH